MSVSVCKERANVIIVIEYICMNHAQNRQKSTTKLGISRTREEKAMDAGILGIDAGGTFTDLALVSTEDGAVLTYAKIKTRGSNMLETIGEGLDMILANTSPSTIKSVCLATTLATNAIVERKTGAVGLILIGYDKKRVEKEIEQNAFQATRVITVAGGHDAKGNETETLDTETLRIRIPETLPNVESFAVSGFFSVRNPTHENVVRDMIHSLSPKTQVTCGHEIATDLDAMLRAVTVSLNAGLIPIMMRLFDAVIEVLTSRDINAPVSIVKSDGSLVSVDWAKFHPIETIFSGPASSAIGACHLSKSLLPGTPAWVLDIGGTTTDIIHIDSNGHPDFNPVGATIGDFKTLVKTIDTHSFGLGGDSRISPRDKKGAINIGPRRVKPLCSAAADDNLIPTKLNNASQNRKVTEPLVIVKGDKAKSFFPGNDFEKKLMSAIQNDGVAAGTLLKEEFATSAFLNRLNQIETTGAIALCGFTPTDVLHIQKRFTKWDRTASCIGAEILAQGRESIQSFCQDAYLQITIDIALNVLRKSLSRMGSPLKENGEAEKIILDGFRSPDAKPRIEAKLDGTLIGVGAPAWAFIKEVAFLLGTNAVTPKYAEVAGAIGAAIGRFHLQHTVLIHRIGESFRAYLPDGIKDFAMLDEAVEYSKTFMHSWLTDAATCAGAVAPVISCVRSDETTSPHKKRTKMYLWTNLTFHASAEMKPSSEIAGRENQ